MKITARDNGILLTDIQNFDPFLSCECGQCFRFEKLSDDEYLISACNRNQHIRRENNGWFFPQVTEEVFKKELVPYFDLERDYGAIIESFSFDSAITAAAKSASGIRIFKQDPWETLISFIISANNNIPRIKKIINSLCTLLGEENNGFYSFPSAEAILRAGAAGLEPIRSGFRAKYILDAAEKVASGSLDLKKVAQCDYQTALSMLKTVKGVGDKVANCVLLFGFGFYEAFPIDVWVKRVIAQYYNESFDPASLGQYAGIAQQYLFHHQRSSGSF